MDHKRTIWTLDLCRLRVVVPGSRSWMYTDDFNPLSPGRRRTGWSVLGLEIFHWETAETTAET